MNENKTILVTGGAGFIGTNFILDWLDNHENSVINLDALTYSGNPKNLTPLAKDPRYNFIKGSILDKQLLEEVFQKYQPSFVINFAAESHVDRSIYNPETFVETNVIGTYCLLDSALRYWQKIEEQKKSAFRFLHVSTDEVYGSLEPAEPLFTEKNQYRPNSPYSASKAASDHFVRAYHHTYGLPVLTTNCSNNYGPFQFPEKLIPLIITNALTWKPLPVYGDGLNVRDWLYVNDHCRAIRIVLTNGSVGEMYNIGGANEKTNLEIVHSICEILDEIAPSNKGKFKELIEFVTDRPGHDRRYAINSNKIRSELGWHPKETFETGIRKTVIWYLKNQDWVKSIKSGAYLEWIKNNYQNRKAFDYER